jgi:hypothetical protein
VLETLDKTVTYDILTRDKMPLGALQFYAAVFTDGTGPHISFVRKSDPHVSLRHGRILGVFDGALTKLETPVFLFSESFDLIGSQDDVLAFRMSVFKFLLRDTEALQARVPLYISTIAQALPFGPGAEAALQALAAKSPRVLGKLSTLHERDYIHHITLDQVKSYIAVIGEDPARFIQDGKLVIDNSDPHMLLQLLCEDLFTGSLSGNKYAVDSKALR